MCFVVFGVLSSENCIVEFVKIYGDGVKDVVLFVDDVDKVYLEVVKCGVVVIVLLQELIDEDGILKKVVIGMYGDIIYMFVECKNYKGVFMLGF